MEIKSRNSWLLVILFLLILVGIVGECAGCATGLPAPAAGVYYVAPNGDDNRSAKQASHIRTPWKTIQKCASLAEAGNTCVIRAGTYRETVTPAHSGQAGRPITFRNYPGEKVIIKALKLSLPAAVS